MIQSQTYLRVSENSGAKKLKCIKVLGGFKKKSAGLGSLIIGSIQQVKQHKKKKVKVKEGEVISALVIRNCRKTVRKNFSRFCFKENSVVLLANRVKPVSTRVLGPVSKEMRHTRFMKVASLASGFI